MDKIEKIALTVRIDNGLIEKLKQICAAERRSQSVMIELMIEGYKFTPVKQETVRAEPTPQTKPIEAPKPLPKPPIPVKKVVTSPTIKDEPKKFNLLEAMANASNKTSY